MNARARKGVTCRDQWTAGRDLVLFLLPKLPLRECWTLTGERMHCFLPHSHTNLPKYVQSHKAPANAIPTPPSECRHRRLPSVLLGHSYRRCAQARGPSINSGPDLEAPMFVTGFGWCLGSGFGMPSFPRSHPKPYASGSQEACGWPR